MGWGGAFLALRWLAVVAAAPAVAATLDVGLVDEDGKPLPRVAVYAVPAGSSANPVQAINSPSPPAVMDQERNAFVPHILVVQKGADVIFPNNDTVSHHVYSFSQAKSFELALYKGNSHAPVQFDMTGVVTVGCNIHDGMLGYILVVDTPYFALTDADGKVHLDGLPPGQYSVSFWTPRLRPNQQPPALAVDLATTSSAALAVEVRGKLTPDHDHSNPSLKWYRY
jgi:plastocyanin